MQLVAGRTQQAPAVWLQHLPTCLSLLAQEWVHLLPTSVASPTRVALHLPSRTQSPLDSPGLPLAGPLYTRACLGLEDAQPPSLSLTPITLTTVLGKARGSLTLSCMGQEGIREGPTYSGWVLEAPTTIHRATAQPE